MKGGSLVGTDIVTGLNTTDTNSVMAFGTTGGTDFMKDTITTAENIAIKIYEELESDIKATGNQLYSVKLYETENNYVEYYG